jgi:uncharacterized protein (TIGR02996 family)
MTLTDHPEWQALLAGICAEPHDDLRRLVAADWLTEHGEEEYAEFIRLQCGGSDAAALTPDMGGWLDSLPPGTAYTTCEDALTLTAPAVLVRRGFADVVRAPLAWLIGGECEVCRDWPGRLRPRGSTPPTRCPRCETTTGRTPAHLDELVRCQPLTRVVVTDAIRRVGHGWGAPHDFQPMPSEVWEEFTNTDEGYPFETEQAASDALSAALLTPARERAGLPALHPAATLEVAHATT